MVYDKNRRRQARALILTALRVIRDTENEYAIPVYEGIEALAKLHRDQGNWHTAQFLYQAANQIKREGLR